MTFETVHLVHDIPTADLTIGLPILLIALLWLWWASKGWGEKAEEEAREIHWLTCRRMANEAREEAEAQRRAIEQALKVDIEKSGLKYPGD
jgi:hypothetical protein